MGNCVRHEAMQSWAEEEDWDLANSGETKTRRSRSVVEEEEEEKKERLLEVGKASSTEVKIKLTKKQLEELLKSVDGGALQVHQLLARLVSGRDVEDAAHWRPVLQSIPETAES